MSRNCPVCGSSKRDTWWRSDFLVPEGWTQPEYLDWFVCDCGMIYGDNPDMTQEHYDQYYQGRYGYGVEDQEQQVRMKTRAKIVHNMSADRNAIIVDYGGGDGQIESILRKEYGFKNVYTVNCGDDMPNKPLVILAEHVLEHVYDMDATMTAFRKIKPGGYLVVDIPDAETIAYCESEAMPMLDYHQKHINHFTQADMMSLMHRNGFTLEYWDSYTERNLPCKLYVFRYRVVEPYNASMRFVKKNMAKKVEKLKALGDKPVIVWGLGDIALYCLAQHMPNVVYFVDNDPAYRDGVVAGLPVLDKQESDESIVIIAQSQKKKLIENIRKMGAENEIIEI